MQQRDIIIEKLKEQGCRITKQRLMLLDIILEEKCSCCKEIYYKASKKDSKIGAATVYRMVNTLEEIGAINRKNMYRIDCGENCDLVESCTVQFDDDTSMELPATKWNQIVQTGLMACGYTHGKKVIKVKLKPCVNAE